MAYVQYKTPVSIDLQISHRACATAAIRVNVRLLFDNRRTHERFFRASHAANGNRQKMLSLMPTTCTIGFSNFRLSYTCVTLTITATRFLMPRSAT